MIRRFLFSMMLGALLMVNAQTMQEADPVIEIVDFDTFEPYLQIQDDTVRVLNFWATWCIPCVKELPVFLEAHEMFQERPVKISLINLDFPNHMETRVIPFIKARNIKPEVVMLDDPDGNRWIPKVDQNWSGAIPATLVYSNKGRLFREGMIDEKVLHDMIRKLL